MRIALFVYGSWGDLRPYVVLGTGLKAAGHDVKIVAPQNYEEWVRARNLDFHPISVDVFKIVAENAERMSNLVEQIQLMRKVVSPSFLQMGRDVLEATRDVDVLVTIEFGLSLLLGVIQTNRLKTIIANPAPLNPTREFASAGVPPTPAWLPFKSAYNRWSASFIHRAQWSLLAGPRNDLNTKHLGLPKSKFSDFKATVAATPALTIVSPNVVKRPADWPDHWQITGYLLDDDPEWTPPPDLTDFLAAGEAPVYLGFGSMVDSKPEATTRMMIDAVQRTGKRAIILKGWAGFGLEDVPENIYILNYAPHSWLFPKMAAVVHHGGSGTTAEGLRAGVPTTIVPHSGDQAFWGRRLVQLGVGTDPIPRGKLNVENLTQAIQMATTNSAIRENARALSAKIRQEDGLGLAVQWIERFLA